MDGVERLTQMSEVERMREIMDVISNSMHKQNDKDRMEILAMLANTTATETNLMSVNFARRANTQATGTKTKKKKGKALIKGVEQAENEKDKSQTQPNNQKQNSQQQPNQPQQQPANALATRTQQALDKKKRLAGKGTLATVGTIGTVVCKQY